MIVEVIVPWGEGPHRQCPHRQAALEWVTAQFRERHPDWTVTVAEPQGRAGAGNIAGEYSWPWVKADAVNPAVAASTADILVVSDGDVWCDGTGAAVDAIKSGRYVWAVPHGRTRRFTAEHTARVLAGADPTIRVAGSLEERPRFGPDGGGLVVARRHVLVDVPLDARFQGWGGEDAAWGYALNAVHGRPWRGTADLIHLWHPPQDRPGRGVLPPENEALCRRYHAARRRPATMRAILDEADPRRDDR